MNYYQILKIKEDATTEQIKQQYKHLIKTYHPDLYEGDKAYANEKTKEITEAYKILVNPTTRNDYDLLLESEKYNIIYEENIAEYDYTHTEGNQEEFDSNIKDAKFFKKYSKKYHKTVYDVATEQYDKITEKTLDYIFSSNNILKILFFVILILVVLIFFFTQILELKNMKLEKIKNSVVRPFLYSTPKYEAPSEFDLATISEKDLKDEFGDDVLNYIEDGPFEDINELKMFYYYNQLSMQDE